MHLIYFIAIRILIAFERWRSAVDRKVPNLFLVRMATSALLEFERPVRPSSDYALLMIGPSATARVGLG